MSGTHVAIAGKSARTDQMASGEALIVIEVDWVAIVTLSACYDLAHNTNALNEAGVLNTLRMRLASGHASRCTDRP